MPPSLDLGRCSLSRNLHFVPSPQDSHPKILGRSFAKAQSYHFRTPNWPMSTHLLSPARRALLFLTPTLPNHQGLHSAPLSPGFHHLRVSLQIKSLSLRTAPRIHRSDWFSPSIMSPFQSSSLDRLLQLARGLHTPLTLGRLL